MSTVMTRQLTVTAFAAGLVVAGSFLTAATSENTWVGLISSLVILAVVSALAIGVVAWGQRGHAGRPAAAALVAAILGILSSAAWWTAAPLVLGGAAYLLATEARTSGERSGIALAALVTGIVLASAIVIYLLGEIVVTFGPGVPE